MGRDTVRLRSLEGGRNRHGAGDHRLLPPAPRALQSAQDRGLRTAPQDFNGQAAEVQAARAGQSNFPALSGRSQKVNLWSSLKSSSAINTASWAAFPALGASLLGGHSSVN